MKSCPEHRTGNRGASLKKHQGGLVFRVSITLLAVAGLLTEYGVVEAHRSFEIMGLVLPYLDKVDVMTVALLLRPHEVLGPLPPSPLSSCHDTGSRLLLFDSDSYTRVMRLGHVHVNEPVGLLGDCSHTCRIILGKKDMDR